MSTNANACPKCGAEIPSSGMSHAVGDQPLHQDATCPKCGAKLTRNVGDAWREDKQP
jgi:ribosomal protein S27AE